MSDPKTEIIEKFKNEGVPLNLAKALVAVSLVQMAERMDYEELTQKLDSGFELIDSVYAPDMRLVPVSLLNEILEGKQSAETLIRLTQIVTVVECSTK